MNETLKQQLDALAEIIESTVKMHNILHPEQELSKEQVISYLANKWIKEGRGE